MVTGEFNSTMTQIVKMFRQIAASFVLSRMLSPADFDPSAMASSVYGLVYRYTIWV